MNIKELVINSRTIVCLIFGNVSESTIATLIIEGFLKTNQLRNISISDLFFFPIKNLIFKDDTGVKRFTTRKD